MLPASLWAGRTTENSGLLNSAGTAHASVIDLRRHAVQSCRQGTLFIADYDALPANLGRTVEGAQLTQAGDNDWLAAAIAYTRRKPGRVLLAVLALHLVIWTVLPILLCPNLQLDLVED